MKRKTNGEYHIMVSVRDANFNRVEEFTCSGKNAILDAIYRLDQKFNVSPIEILKKYW